MDEVRRLAAELRERHPRIDVLANNAGAMFTSRHVTPDGFEQTFALNHLAPFLLTNLLLDRLVASRARVVTTASDAHKGGVARPRRPPVRARSLPPRRVYGTTKLCNILFTRELQRRHPELAANCFHPGVIRTGFGKNDGRSRGSASPSRAVPALARHRRAPLVWLALDPAARRAPRRIRREARPAQPSAQAQDDAPRRRVVGALGGADRRRDGGRGPQPRRSAARRARRSAAAGPPGPAVRRASRPRAAAT